MKYPCFTFAVASLLFGVPILMAEPLLGGFKADQISYWVAQVDNEKVLSSHRANVSVKPASTLKILTSYLALNTLGPQYRYRTEFKSNAEIVNDTLKGNLYWVGSGDPSFNAADLFEMQKQLRLLGIKNIEGRVILDKSNFKVAGSADEFDADANRAFTVEPDAHLLNLKVSWLRLEVDGAKTKWVANPPLSSLSINNQVKWSNNTGACPSIKNLVTLKQDKNNISLSGEVPKSCQGAMMYVNVLDTNTFAQEAFNTQWALLGGRPVSFEQGLTPSGARNLAVHDSNSLAALLQDVNKFSNNTMARSILLSVGQTRNKQNPMLGVQSIVKEKFAQDRISTAGLVIENGSGLSRKERMSAEQLGLMLLRSMKGPWGSELQASLPIAGVDGTLRRRFSTLGAQWRFKTGSLDDVISLAGMGKNAQGQDVVLVVVVNMPQAGATLEGLDKLLIQLIRSGVVN